MGATRPHLGGWVTTTLTTVTLQHGEFKDCVVPSWRISDQEPADLKKGPEIPEDAKWKFSG